VGPTNIACRLLQLQTRRTSTTHERWSPQRDEGRNPLHVLCSVATSVLRQRASGPRATNSEEVTLMPLSPVKAWGHQYNLSIHLDDVLRRRLPVALVLWVRRPSEGPALLRWLREFPSSATPEHPSLPVSPAMRFGDPSSRSKTSQRPSLEHHPAKGGAVLRIRVPFTASASAISFVGSRGLLLCPVAETVSPHAAPRKEHCEALRHRSRWRITSLGF
jgi:hypothetical protein